ncbi:MAG: helix-turn-helix transcriptional regulator [Clostridia bacterium]|nr:helix-turn-helix transcriptional regulator [Clostridia bacterium]
MAVDAYNRTIPEKSNNIIIDVKRYVDNNYRDPQLSLKAVAERFGYSPKYISDKFTHTVTTTLTEYITTRRMEFAKAMIREGGYSVSQISEACGYNDPLYFSRVFKQDFGCSPTTYINNGGTP